MEPEGRATLVDAASAREPPEGGQMAYPIETSCEQQASSRKGMTSLMVKKWRARASSPVAIGSQTVYSTANQFSASGPRRQ
jgi:hypothetical protein